VHAIIRCMKFVTSQASTCIPVIPIYSRALYDLWGLYKVREIFQSEVTKRPDQSPGRKPEIASTGKERRFRNDTGGAITTLTKTYSRSGVKE
jgi:hypothetical protein